MLTKKVIKSGSSLFVLIPSSLAELMGVEEGSTVELKLKGHTMIITPK